MTAISVTSVNVLDNPTKITNPLQFEIQYECLYDLQDGKEGSISFGVGCYMPGPWLHTSGSVSPRSTQTWSGG